jgi:hypothetical protein
VDEREAGKKGGCGWEGGKEAGREGGRTCALLLWMPCPSSHPPWCRRMLPSLYTFSVACGQGGIAWVRGHIKLSKSSKRYNPIHKDASIPRARLKDDL